MRFSIVNTNSPIDLESTFVRYMRRVLFIGIGAVLGSILLMMAADLLRSLWLEIAASIIFALAAMACMVASVLRVGHALWATAQYAMCELLATFLVASLVSFALQKWMEVSFAHMRSPGGWVEPGQTPEFDEYTVVLTGTLRVETKGETLDVHAGQAVITKKGEWVRYSTPQPGGAEYFAVCLAAFSMETVHRDA